jgi:hypothetical protein
MVFDLGDDGIGLLPWDDVVGDVMFCCCVRPLLARLDFSQFGWKLLALRVTVILYIHSPNLLLHTINSSLHTGTNIVGKFFSLRWNEEGTNLVPSINLGMDHCHKKTSLPFRGIQVFAIKAHINCYLPGFCFIVPI